MELCWVRPLHTHTHRYISAKLWTNKIWGNVKKALRQNPFQEYFHTVHLFQYHPLKIRNANNSERNSWFWFTEWCPCGWSYPNLIGGTHFCSASWFCDNVVNSCTHYDYYTLICKKARELTIPPRKASRAAEMSTTSNFNWIFPYWNL